MEPEKIELAKFNFNIDDLVRSASELKEVIDDTKKEQAELRKENKASSAQYIENEVALKSLNSEYRKHIKMMSEVQEEQAQTASRSASIAVAIETEATTIKGLRDQNKILNDLRNTANLKTAEGRQELERLNNKLNENNEIIKENVDAYTQQKINIGNYKDSITEALGELNIFEGGLQSVAGNVQVLMAKASEAGGVNLFLASTFKTVQSSLAGLLKTMLAFLATPIGAALAVIGAAFLLIQNAMNRSEATTFKLRKAFAALGGIMDKLLTFLEPVGEFLIDVLIAALEDTEKKITLVMRGIEQALGFLGLEDARKSMKSFNDEVADGVKTSRELVEQEEKLLEARRKQEITLKKYELQAEKLRQIRDNEAASTKERIQANEELGQVLTQQAEDEKELAQNALNLAQLRIKATGDTTENLDAQAEAQLKLLDIEERVNSQRSEQLTNRVALEKEAQEAYEEAVQERLEKQEQEIALFESQQSYKAKTLSEELEFERELSNQKKELLKEELRTKQKSYEEYTTEINNLNRELALKQAEVAVEIAGREIEAERDAIEKRLDEKRYLSDQALQLRINDLERDFQLQEEYAQTRLDQGVINQNEYDEAVRIAKEENRLAVREAEIEREAVRREEEQELRALDFEAELERQLQEGATKFEIERAQQAEQRRIALLDLEQQKNDQLISEEVYQARLAKIDRQAKKQEVDRQETLRSQRVEIASGMINAISQVVDKQSKVGKGIAVAQALINTYQGISAGVKLGFPMAIPAVAFAAATGFKAVKDILKTNVPSANGSGTASGGGAGGGAGAQGSAPNVSTLSTSLASSSGVNLSAVSASGNSAVQQTVDRQIGTENLVANVAEGVAQGAERGTSRGAESGMTNLSNNRAVANESRF